MMTSLLGKIKTVWKWIRATRRRTIVSGVLTAGVLVLIVMSGGDPSSLRTVSAQVGDVIQEVNITARVKAADQVRLTFEQSGRIIGIPAKVGQRTRPGQTLMYLDTSDLHAQLLREQANVRAAQIRLEQLRATSSTNVANLEAVLYQVKTRDGIAAARSAFTTALNGIITITDFQYKYTPPSPGADSLRIADSKAVAIKALYGENVNGNVLPWYVMQLHGGTEQKLTEAERSPDTADVSALLFELHEALRAVRQVFDAMIGLGNVVSISTTDMAALQSTQASIIAASDKALGQAEAILNAENNLRTARAKFNSVAQGGESLEVEAGEADLQQAQAGLALIQAQISKRILRAPIAGVVTRVEGALGELATGANAGVSIIGDAKFQIEANVPEADIAKMRVGQIGEVTLDAFGPDQVFHVTVIAIDPAETILDGVATYRVTLEFTDANEKILPGLTANIDVRTNTRTQVLYAPTREISFRDGKRWVRVLRDPAQGTIEDVEVTVGVRGSDGRTEILSGLREGDLIISE